MEVREVIFAGDAVMVIKENETVYVPAKQVAQYLGLDWEGQRKKLLSSRVLSKGTVSMSIPSAGGNQEGLALRVDLLPAWLFMVNESRVKKSVREKLVLYQEKAVQVLSAAFVPPELKSDATRVAEAQTVAQTHIPQVQAQSNPMDLMTQQYAMLGNMIQSLQKHDMEIAKVSTTVTALDGQVAEIAAYTTGARGKTVITKAGADAGVDLSDIRDAQACGLIATNMCKARGIKIEKVFHPYFPRGVNEYPADIALEAVRIWKSKSEGKQQS